VDVLAGDLVRARGFKVTTMQEAGRKGCTDDEQLSFAVNRQLTLVTHNRADFEALAQEYFAAGKKHCGIIIAVRRPAHDLARRLRVILNHVTADEMENQVRYI